MRTMLLSSLVKAAAVALVVPALAVARPDSAETPPSSNQAPGSGGATAEASDSADSSTSSNAEPTPHESAEGPAPADELERSERALRAGHGGLEHFRAGDFLAAYESFDQADRLMHSPVFSLYMARCQERLGRLIDARALLQNLSEEALPEEAPATWTKAVGEGREELEALVPRIATVAISIRGALELPATLRDGARAVVLDGPDETLDFDPGRHELVLSDRAGREVALTVELAEGESDRSVLFAVQPEPEPATHLSTPVVSSGKGPVAREADASPSSHRAAGYTAFALGGAGLVFGAVTGGLAVARAQEVKQNCVGSVCNSKDEPTYQEARKFANLATVGFAVALVGAGTGLTLLLTEPTPSGSSVSVNLHPSGATLSGRF